MTEREIPIDPEAYDYPDCPDAKRTPAAKDRLAETLARVRAAQAVLAAERAREQSGRDSDLAPARPA